LRTIAEAVVETLVPELPEDLLASNLKQPDAVIDVLAAFRSSLAMDLLRAVSVGSWAFGQARLRVVSESEEAKPTADKGETSQALQVIAAEISKLRVKSREALDSLDNWGNVQRQLLQADLAGRQIRDALIESNTTSPFRWFWPLTGRAAHIRQIRRTVTPILKDLEVVPDCPPAPRFSNNDVADLSLLDRDFPAWLKLARGRVESGLNHCAQEIEWWQAVSLEARQRLEALAAERTEAEEESKNELVAQEQRRLKRIASLRYLEKQTPSLGFFRTRRCSAVAAARSTVCFVGETEELIRCWTVDGGEISPLASEARVLATSPDGSFLAAGDFTGQVELWPGPMLPRLRRTMARSPIHSLAFGAGWLFAGLNHNVTVYAMPGLQEIAVLGGIEGRVAGIACDPDRRRLYVLASHISQPLYSAVYVWELPSTGGRFRLCRRLYGFGGRATCLAADSNGRWIAAGEALGSANDPNPSQVLVWDASTLRLKNVLTYHEGWVGALAFSPDGKHLISGDSGYSVRPRDESPLFVYDMQADRLTLRVNAHRGGICSIAVDPDGQFLVSGGADGVWVWSVDRLTPSISRGIVQTVDRKEALHTLPPRDFAREAKLRQNLRVKVMYDEAKVDRLIAFERERAPGAALVELMESAIERWERDNRD
jgi:hypothetical protein